MHSKTSAFHLHLVRRAWRTLPASIRRTAPGRAFGMHVERVVRRCCDRRQHFATFFLRNRPELAMLSQIAAAMPQGAQLNMTVLACSKGAEVYSMVWAIRSARPDLRLNVHAVDISPDIVEFARRGVYSMRRPTLADRTSEEIVQRRAGVAAIPSSDPYAWLFERVSRQELADMFDVRDDEAAVKPWLREGISWSCGDASDPALLEQIGGRQHIVTANRFLCHMHAPDAQKCLRNIGRLVTPGGYLFVSGVDLDVRTTIAQEQQWLPVTDRIRELHDGDESLRNAWPLEWWGLEPFDESRQDWQYRYASVFQIGIPPAPVAVEPHREYAQQ